jgi:hypothetical protein
LVQVDDAAICGVPDVLFVEVEGLFSEVESLEFFLELLLRIEGEVDRGVLLGGVKTVGDLISDLTTFRKPPGDWTIMVAANSSSKSSTSKFSFVLCGLALVSPSCLKSLQSCTSTIGTFFNLKLPLPDEAFEDPALVPGPVNWLLKLTPGPVTCICCNSMRHRYSTFIFQLLAHHYFTFSLCF